MKKTDLKFETPYILNHELEADSYFLSEVSEDGAYFHRIVDGKNGGEHEASQLAFLSNNLIEDQLFEMTEKPDDLRKAFIEGDKIQMSSKLLENFRTQDINQTLCAVRRRMNVYWSWGPHALTNIANKVLRFKVQGFNHKGHVYILLSGNDTYTVVFTTVRGKIKASAWDVYAEDLQDVVDVYVEKGCSDDEYRDRVKKATYSL